MLGQPRCWDCCNPLIREALEAAFIDNVMKGVEQGGYGAGDIALARENTERFCRDPDYTWDDIDAIDDDSVRVLTLAFVRQELRAMRERVDQGREGTWNADGTFTPERETEEHDDE